MTNQETNPAAECDCQIDAYCPKCSVPDAKSDWPEARQAAGTAREWKNVVGVVIAYREGLYEQTEDLDRCHLVEASALHAAQARIAELEEKILAPEDLGRIAGASAGAAVRSLKEQLASVTHALTERKDAHLVECERNNQLRAEVDRLKIQLSEERKREFPTQSQRELSMALEIQTLIAKLEQLKLEIEILRRYGNKDCTAMADEALEKIGRE